MNIESLKLRAAELQASIAQITNQVLILQGHKNEIDYQISLLINEKEKEDVAVAESVAVE